jgi:SAM-dependent methyltransferase
MPVLYTPPCHACNPPARYRPDSTLVSRNPALLDSEGISCNTAGVKTPFSSSDTVSDWFHQSFGALYPLVYAHRNDLAAEQEVRALSRWVPLESGRRLLDACCGNGRHLKALQKLECNAFGFDLSPALVAECASDPPVSGKICRADIRHIPFDECFDCVLNLFSSFGYFADDSENQSAFAELCRCLKPGGILVMDHINASRTRRTLVPKTASVTGGYRIVQHRRISGNRVQKRIEITGLDGEQRVFHEDVRLYEPVELIDLGRKAGLSDMSLHGDFSGSRFHDDSSRMILKGYRRPL